MRIEGNYQPQPATETQSGRSQNLTPSGSAASAAAAGNSALGKDPGADLRDGLGEDQTQISGAHVQLQALTAQAIQLPEVRLGRVTPLRLAVENGNYDPTPEQIAGGLLAALIVPAA